MSDCSWRYESLFNAEQSFQLINIHVDRDHGQQSHATRLTSKAVKWCPPEIEVGMDQDTLKTFVNQWRQCCKDLNDVFALIECKHDTLSTCNKQQKHASNKSSRSRKAPKKSPIISCTACGRPFREFNGRNVKAFKCCIKCFQQKTISHSSMFIDQDSIVTPINKSESAFAQDESANCIELSNIPGVMEGNDIPATVASVRSHPKITLQISPAGECNSATVVGVADTGAQSNLWGMTSFLNAGFKKDILEPVSIKMSSASSEPISIEGGFLADISGDSPEGKRLSCREIIYVSKSVTGLFFFRNSEKSSNSS